MPFKGIVQFSTQRLAHKALFVLLFHNENFQTHIT